MTYEQTELAKINLLLHAYGVRPTTASLAVAETLVELIWRRKEWWDTADDYGEVRSEAVVGLIWLKPS